jgi:hypothetical protein
VTLDSNDAVTRDAPTVTCNVTRDDTAAERSRRRRLCRSSPRQNPPSNRASEIRGVSQGFAGKNQVASEEPWSATGCSSIWLGRIFRPATVIWPLWQGLNGHVPLFALAPARRMMDRAPDLMGLQGMLAHAVRSGSRNLSRTTAEN